VLAFTLFIIQQQTPKETDPTVALWCEWQRSSAESSSLQNMATYPLFRVDLHLVRWLISFVSRDTDLLGHVCGYVKQMGDGQAARLSATVRK